MKKFKTKVVKLTISGILIFTLGILVGYQLNGNKITSIQGYLFNAASEATNANASDSNASDSNASDSNASDSNASDANASNANASSTDNIIYLQGFHITTKNAKAGDKVYVNIVTSGACLNGATLIFKNQTNDTTFSAQVKSIGDNPYIVLPGYLSSSIYEITDLLLIGINSDNTTFSKHYSNKSGNNVSNWELVDIIHVTALENTKKITLNNLSIESTIAEVGTKVYLTINASETLNSLKLVFKNTNNEEMAVYAKFLNNKPYFEIPSTAKAGTYKLNSATLTSSSSTQTYSIDGASGTEKFAFNISLEVKNENENNYIYNNEDINSDIITKLYNAANGTSITINADANTLIKEELFTTIKGKNKKLIINYKDNQIIFNGNDITTPKTIDVNLIVNNITGNENISKLVTNGIIVSFPDNGNLPGKALIRIKATNQITSVLNNKVYVYVYNDSSNDFCVIDDNAKKTSDDYYEFTVTHNTDYLIVNEELDSNLVVIQEDNNIVSFQKGNNTYLMLIGIGIGIILIVLIVTEFVKKGPNNQQ